MKSAAPTVIAAFSAVMATDATRPLLTYYDDVTGERLDLSGATLGNWVAKTANLLVDGHGLGPGDTVGVRLPPHWLTAAVLLGCWSAGVAVAVGPPGAVEFVTTDTVGGAAGDVYALALAPFGMPFRDGPPPGTLDFAVEVRGYGDHFTPRVDPGMAALADGTTHAELVAGARSVPGPRVLVDAQATPDPRDWLVAPLLAGASIVLCSHLDAARLPDRLAAEHAIPL
jgi:uncharacterized protein (TIGR03089 family)